MSDPAPRAAHLPRNRRPVLQWRLRAWCPPRAPHFGFLRARRGGSSVLPAEILREAGRGRLATVVVGGFVPDPSEAVHCQRRLFRRFGDIYYLQFPPAGFDREALHAQLLDLLDELARRRQQVVLFGVSFGCALICEFLSQYPRLRDALAGLVLISPVLSLEDLGPRDGERTLVGRFAWPMACADDAETVTASIRAARRFFARLFAAGSRNRAAFARLRWRGQGEMLRNRILATVEAITSEGARGRLAELGWKSPLPNWQEPLVAVPALVLFAEREEAVIAGGAPVRQLLASPGVLSPRARAETVRSNDGDAVQHASLIFHARQYRRPLQQFYGDLQRERERKSGSRALPPLLARLLAGAS